MIAYFDFSLGGFIIQSIVGGCVDGSIFYA